MGWPSGNAARRIGNPPTVEGNPGLNRWLQDVANVLNTLPRMSVFSGPTPNSVLSGYPGDLAVNIGSASSSSRLWIHGSNNTVPTFTNWAVVRVLE
jgi:hypothetical protein